MKKSGYKITKYTGYDGTDLEKMVMLHRITSISPQGNWTRVFYKVPHGRKQYSFIISSSDIQEVA